MRCAWWVVLVAGCNPVLGIQDLPRGTGDASSAEEAGATFTYANAECQRCVEKSCAAEEQACGRDPSCTDLYACVAARPLDDLAGRATCYDDHDVAMSGAPAKALDACRRKSCIEACLGTGGLVTTLGDACRKCVDASTTCQANTEACFAYPDCERKVAAFMACSDPACRFKAMFDQHPPPDADKSEVISRLVEVRRCLSDCDGDCRFGEDFACVGNYQWGHAPVSQDSITMTGTMTYLNPLVSDGGAAQPVVGATVEACLQTGVPGCSATGTPATSTAEGSVTLQLPLFSGRFDGHLHVSGANVFDFFAYAGRPVSLPEGDVGLAVYAPDTFKATAAVFGVTPDNTLGHLTLAMYSCWRLLAGGVTITLDSGAATTTTFESYYPLGKATTPGVGAWVALNINPGKRLVTAKLGDKVVVDQYPVPVTANAITQITLFPDPMPAP